MALPVSDLASNAAENIHYASTIIGRSKERQRVFDAIYTGKKRVKTVRELAVMTGLSEKRVLTAGKKLAANHIVDQTKRDGRVAYQKIDFFHHHKAKILSLAGSPSKRAAFPTKRNPSGRLTPVKVTISPKRAQLTQVTIDDIGSFKKAWSVDTDAEIPKSISETQFRTGVQRILGELGTFKDWGGERSDLHSTRLLVGGKRRATAFAFKGPGTKGRLTPGKMGKNGDQIQRLFETPAQVFVVQYCGQIDQSVARQMEGLAVAKSTMTGQPIWYGIIDGKDSNRLYLAYKDKFQR